MTSYVMADYNPKLLHIQMLAEKHHVKCKFFQLISFLGHFS